MGYPAKVLGDEEEVVRHLHPHWLTVFWPIVAFLVLVGVASFGAAVVPEGTQQGRWRMVVVGVALLLALRLVLLPLLRWRTTHYVITTHRLLYRVGILARTGRDVGLSRITDVTYRRSLWDRVVDSGTVTIETAGEGGPTVLPDVPDSDGVQQLLSQLVDEDAERRRWGMHGPSDTLEGTTAVVGVTGVVALSESDDAGPGSLGRHHSRWLGRRG